MSVSTLKATFDCDIIKIWDIVTDVKNYPVWRSDLGRTEILDKHQFIEYTKSGYSTMFTITMTKPYSRWEFDMDNSNMSGHWGGAFLQDGDITTITFTEDITAKKWFLKPFVRSYLRKQQEQFVKDLKKKLQRKEE